MMDSSMFDDNQSSSMMEESMFDDNQSSKINFAAEMKTHYSDDGKIA